MNQSEIGKKRLEEILGENGKSVIEYFNKISPDFANYIINFGYGELYTRKTLSDKDRELIAVTSLISQGKTGVALKAHVIGMLNVGWSEKEIIEVIIFLIGYTGFPATVDAIKVAQEVFESRK